MFVIQVVHSFDPKQFEAIVHGCGSSTSDNQGAEILRRLIRIETLVQEVNLTDQELQALLGKVDATTTKIGSNLSTVATAQAAEAETVQTISNEIDTLIAGGISAASATKLQDIADRLQASSDNSDTITAAIQAQVPVLTAIAEKGAPVSPEPPPAPVVPVS